MIKMIGIDHTTADVDVRVFFAYRKSELVKKMNDLVENYGDARKSDVDAFGKYFENQEIS